MKTCDLLKGCMVSKQEVISNPLKEQRQVTLDSSYSLRKTFECFATLPLWVVVVGGSFLGGLGGGGSWSGVIELPAGSQMLEVESLELCILDFWPLAYQQTTFFTCLILRYRVACWCLPIWMLESLELCAGFLAS